MFLQLFEDKIKSFFENDSELIRIAIQIPDTLIHDTLEIYRWFSLFYPSKFFFIVSDSSFNDCCVDHISAKHLEADAIIHFGPYCSIDYEIPVCFLADVNTQNNLYDQIYSEIEMFINLITSENVLVILDQVDIPRSIFEKFVSGKKLNLLFSDTEISRVDTDISKYSSKILGFQIPIKSSCFEKTSLIYIGPHEKHSTDLGCIFFNHSSLRINSKNFLKFNFVISRELAKRSTIIDSISNFDHIGIIVENPNVRIHVEMAKCLQNICSANDMIADIIYVGRLNEMKLGNFSDIQFFIHLSCAGKLLFKFVKPVVSPFEFICAKFDINFWENQNLRDYEIFLGFYKNNKGIFLSNQEVAMLKNQDQVVVKNFYELSNQLNETRKNYSYSGLKINSIDQEMKLFKGAVGNSTAYDYESKQ